MLYRSYAKVNFTLEVVGKREDGFHELASLVHTINLADDLHVEAADELVTRVEGLEFNPETNLVSRAAELIADTLRERRGAELNLVKRIPTAAGLGGGSSDAATTLVGLNTLWGSRLSLAQLIELAAQLGSDIPFFIRGGAGLMRGRGDELQVVAPLIGQWLVLVVPPHSIIDKTRTLYAALEPGDFSAGHASQRAADRLSAHLPIREVDLTNAFTRAARMVFPELTRVWREVEDATGRRFSLTGAGPAIFSLASDRADARRQIAALAPRGITTFAARTVKHARASLIGYA